MLLVRIELHSAVTGRVREIGRLIICNDGTGTVARGNYECVVLRKGPPWDREQRRCAVTNYPRRSYNVWRLVLRALRGCFPEESLGRTRR